MTSPPKKRIVYELELINFNPEDPDNVKALKAFIEQEMIPELVDIGEEKN